jgi:hypothetical protein
MHARKAECKQKLPWWIGADQALPDLARLVDAWPTLPESIRAGILAMVWVSKR